MATMAVRSVELTVSRGVDLARLTRDARDYDVAGPNPCPIVRVYWGNDSIPVAETRVAYNTTHPDWNQNFTLSLPVNPITDIDNIWFVVMDASRESEERDPVESCLGQASINIRNTPNGVYSLTLVPPTPEGLCTSLGSLVVGFKALWQDSFGLPVASGATSLTRATAVVPISPTAAAAPPYAASATRSLVANVNMPPAEEDMQHEMAVLWRRTNPTQARIQQLIQQDEDQLATSNTGRVLQPSATRSVAVPVVAASSVDREELAIAPATTSTLQPSPSPSAFQAPAPKGSAYSFSTYGRPWIGLVVGPKTGVEGLYVCDLSPGGPAERAGVRWDDQLVALNGKPVNSIAEFENAFQQYGRIGDRLDLEVIRTDPNAQSYATSSAPTVPVPFTPSVYYPSPQIYRPTGAASVVVSGVRPTTTTFPGVVTINSFPTAPPKVCMNFLVAVEVRDPENIAVMPISVPLIRTKADIRSILNDGVKMGVVSDALRGQGLVEPFDKFISRGSFVTQAFRFLHRCGAPYDITTLELFQAFDSLDANGEGTLPIATLPLLVEAMLEKLEQSPYFPAF